MKKKTFHKRMLAAAFAGGLACLAGNAAEGASLGTNLVVNGTFEDVDTGTVGAYGSVLINSWQGSGFAYNYAQNYDNRNANDVPPGNVFDSNTDYYFNGGNGNGGNPIFQDIDVSTGGTGSAISAGKGQYDLNAYFSSYLGQGDYGTVTARFFDSGDVELNSVAIFDDDINGLQEWTQLSATGGIPVGTTRVRVESQGVARGGAPDGYVDNFDFQITESALPLFAALEVNTTVGTMRIFNETGGALDIDFYQILSAGGSLDPVGWNSFDDQDLDATGPNPGESWLEGGGSDTELLTEGFLLGSTSIPMGESRSLGGGYDEGVDAQDLTFGYGLAGGGLVVGPVVYVQGVPCDFDGDGDCDKDDIDLLTLEADLVAGQTVPPAQAKFDLTGDSNVDSADLDKWLTDAATVNSFINPYLAGDADVNHVVDLNDASPLVSNFGTASGAKWSDGDFDGDGDVDLNDASPLVGNFGNADPDTAGASGDAEWTFDAVVNSLSTTITLDATDQAFLSTEALDGAVLTLTQQAVPFSTPQAGPGVQVGEFMTADFVDGQEQILVEVPGPGVYTFEARWNVAGGTEQSTRFTIEFIPEPASLALMGFGGLLFVRRRRSSL